MDDFDGRIDAAIDEFVRYASPVICFARTARVNTQLHGARIAAGDKIALFYCSGNRDESVFTSPGTFDLSRPRAQHVAFGGGGVHFCLGSALAKVQLKSLFRRDLAPHARARSRRARVQLQRVRARRDSIAGAHAPMTR